MSPPMDPHGQWLLEFDRPPNQLLTPDDIYERVDESLLRELFEDRRLEFKPNGQHPDALGDYFSMWANTAPYGGLVVVGIRNDYHVEGCSSLEAKRLNRLEVTGDDYCPDARYQVKRVGIHRDGDGAADFVLVFRVFYHQTRVVKTVASKVFVRRGDRKKELKSPDEIRALQAEKGEISFEAEPCGLEYPRQFDTPSIAKLAASVRKKRGWDDTHSAEDVLQLLHLGRLDGERFIPNFACALVFARDPREVIPGCRIRFLRFEGESQQPGDRWNAVKDVFIDGPIPVLIRETAELLGTQLREFSRLGVGGKFFTSPEYPEFVWYEAIVNACAHRSYGNGTKNAPIFVRMFDDKLVVESPGPFPPAITAENIYEVHAPRNPYLMEAMYYLEYVRMAHEGTKRMREHMLKEELPAPEFRQDEVGHALVRVTLRNNIQVRYKWVDADVVAVLGAQVASLLSPEEKRCLNFCAAHGKINVSDAVRLIGGDWGTMKKMLAGLVTKGILEAVHRADLDRDPAAHYKLKKAPADALSTQRKD